MEEIKELKEKVIELSKTCDFETMQFLAKLNEQIDKEIKIKQNGNNN